MTALPEDHTRIQEVARGPMSVIQQMMNAHRLVGGIVYDAVLAGDWSIISQFKPQHCAPIFPVPDRIVAYHYVRNGTLTCCLPDGPAVSAPAGTMVLFPRNDAHIICSHPSVPPTPAERVFVSTGRDGANIVRIVGDGPECAIYCGWLGVADSDGALLEALPPMLTAAAGDGASRVFLSSSLRYAAEELSARPELVARLSQFFFEEAIRRYLDSVPPDEELRLAALRDPAIGRALALIHREGETAVTLDALARESGLSRTVLAERFVALFGEPPMRYRARWRMRQAARRLREGRETIAAIAHAAGFASESAFARAFKRAYGRSPAAWRDMPERP